MVESQAEIKKDECVPEVVAVGPNSKSFQRFHPWTPLRGLRENG